MTVATPQRTLPHPPDYDWQPQPAAQAVVDEALAAFLARSRPARLLAERMTCDTGTRFVDWVDFIEQPSTPEHRRKLESAGFVRREPDPAEGDAEIHDHHDGLFPMMVLSSTDRLQVGLEVDSVVEFLATWSISDEQPIEGDPLAAVRRAPAFPESDATLWVVERTGGRSFRPPASDAGRALEALRHLEAFRRRRRSWTHDEDGWTRAEHLVDAAVSDLGVDAAAALFFRAERDYWQRRNRAARFQKARQDELGLGWANHDHHTYRSSRKAFSRLVGLLERLGFVCRERFYAGAEAGWGAQVLEQPVCGLVVFADVDLSEPEVAGDFSHEGLEPRDFLGTVGLWVGLHGESMLQAGMHHLECQFDHVALRDQLRSAGIHSMQPFTDLPFLRQAFTEGERWEVAEERLERLLERDLITPAQASQFRMQGAIGSHLENLERHDGYKGFNQQGVSDIIGRTDPRRQGEDTSERTWIGA